MTCCGEANVDPGSMGSPSKQATTVPARGTGDSRTHGSDVAATVGITETGTLLPAVCEEVIPLYPEALQFPEHSTMVAEFPFADGLVVLYRQDQPEATYFGVIECFTGGGAGFSGGEPGETWQGCYRVDYSDARYAIVVVEEPTWDVEVDGEPVELVSAGEEAAGLVEGSFDRPPSLNVTANGESAC